MNKTILLPLKQFGHHCMTTKWSNFHFQITPLFLSHSFMLSLNLPQKKGKKRRKQSTFWTTFEFCWQKKNHCFSPTFRSLFLSSIVRSGAHSSRRGTLDVTLVSHWYDGTARTTFFWATRNSLTAQSSLCLTIDSVFATCSYTSFPRGPSLTPIYISILSPISPFFFFNKYSKTLIIFKFQKGFSSLIVINFCH